MTTMKISLPDSLRDFVNEQVNQHGYGTSREYVRELIRKEQDRRIACSCAASYWPARRPRRQSGLMMFISRACGGESGPPNLTLVGNAQAIVPRGLAKQGADAAISYHLSDNVPEAALGFIDVPKRAHLVFYVERDDFVDVRRDLHGERHTVVTPVRTWVARLWNSRNP